MPLDLKADCAGVLSGVVLKKHKNVNYGNFSLIKLWNSEINE